MQAIKSSTEHTLTTRVVLLRAALIIRQAVRAMFARGVDLLLDAQVRALALLRGIGLNERTAVRAICIETSACRAACC